MTMTTSRLAAVLGLGMAACIGGPGALSPALGVGPANAKAFYTRKRVNGQWIEGRFPKAGASRNASRSRGRAVARAAVPALPLPPRPERKPDSQPAAAVTASLGDDRLSKLHSALQAKAQAIAAAPAEATRSLAIPSAATPLSVTFDFESGMKITRYGGDVLVREPFDAPAMRALASPPPPPAAAAPALSASAPAVPTRSDGKSPDRLPGS